MLGKNLTVKNFMWRLAEGCGAQLVMFIISIVLVRIIHKYNFSTTIIRAGSFIIAFSGIKKD